jgi:hypothetical protein
MGVLLERGLIVCRPTDIVMADSRGPQRRRGDGLGIEPLLENRFQTFIGARADGEGTAARRFEARSPIAFSQTHDAETGAKALLRMGS